MKVIYCTGNKYKLATARQILGPMGVEVEGKKIENLPEIQKLLENLTKHLDCPLAMLDDELNFLWMNAQAVEYFKRKDSLPTNLTECA